MALQGTLVLHRSASVRAEATRLFWEFAGVHGICFEVHYPVLEFAALAGGRRVNHIPQNLVTLRVGLYNPIEAQGWPTSSCSAPQTMLSRYETPSWDTVTRVA